MMYRIKNMIKGKKWAICIIVLALALAAVLFIRFGDDPETEQTEEKLQSVAETPEEQDKAQEELSVITPVVTEEMPCGADGPILDYGDEHLIIFHDYFGLFAYDLAEKKVIGAVDLGAIGCENTQGDNYCEVLTDSNGWKVYLHPISEENMYVYDVLNDRLTKEAYEPEGKEAFYHLKETRDCVDPQNWLRSFYCASLSDDRYLYLESGSDMALDLCYVIEQDHERVQFAKIFDGYSKNREGGEIFAYGNYTGYLGECADWSERGRFQDRDYDEDGSTDRVYRENISDYESCNYRIEFGNGDLMEIPGMGGGIPDVQRCDLDGDGIAEILFRQYYGFSTDPMAFGETAILVKKNGNYEQLMPPQDLCAYMKGDVSDAQGSLDYYQPCLTFCYEKQSEREMRVTAKELAKTGILDEIVWLNDDLAGMFNQPDAEKEHISVCYETTVSEGEQQLLEFHFQVFNKWSLDEVIVTAAYENGQLQIIDSRYEREGDQETADVPNYDITHEEAAIVPEVEMLTFEQAQSQGTLEEWEDDVLPGAGLGTWRSAVADGVAYFYGKYDNDKEGKYELFSWALLDGSHELANGLKVGMSRQEALEVCPDMIQIGFEGEGWPAWNGTAYPDGWTEEFDDILIANIENHQDDLPVFLALMMKSDRVAAITQYAPTAG